jgi:hypothetical protein
MLIKIPSRFLQNSDIDKINEAYINTDHIISIQVTKQVMPKWDKVNKCNIDGEFETSYNPNITLTSGYGVALKWDMDEHEFNDLVKFINEKIYLGKFKDETAK